MQTKDYNCTTEISIRLIEYKGLRLSELIPKYIDLDERDVTEYSWMDYMCERGVLLEVMLNRPLSEFAICAVLFKNLREYALENKEWGILGRVVSEGKILKKVCGIRFGDNAIKC